MMILHKNSSCSTAKVAWLQNADPIADWQIQHLLNRPDQATYWVDNLADWRASPGDVGTRLRENCQRLKPTVGYAYNAAGLCKWVALDWDNHDSSPAVADQNLQMAVGILNTATELGIVCMLEDSDGQGGLHLWLLFSPAIPIAKAYRFAKWLRSDFPAVDIECNPKQRNADSWGNGVRFPGHHHKRNHISRFWGDAEWLEGAEAIELMLNTPTNDPAVLDLMGSYDPDPPPPPKPKQSLPRPQFSGGSGIVAQAEQHIESVPWEELLRHFGWHGEGKRWTRPGKSHGTSATLNHNGNGLFHVFSEAAGLPTDRGSKLGQSYGKWRFWIYSMGFNDSQQREAAKRYMGGQ